MLRWSVCLVAGMLVSAVSLPVAAQWKWRDASGRTQYSDLPPPPGVADKDILSRPANARAVPAPAAGAASAASTPLVAKSVEPELEAKRKAAEQAEAAKRKAEEAKLAATRAENCQRAREQLRTIDSGIRLAKVNERGEREVLDDAGRAQEARRARDVAATDCR